MFLGEYHHNFDYKGRLAVPKKFREEIGKRAILTRGLDGCLFLYTSPAWEELAEKMRELPLTAADARAFGRYLFAGATEVVFDQLGRMVVPEYLRTYAALEKNAVVVGVLDRVELWSTERWTTLQKSLRSKGEEVAERLKSSGI